MGSAELSPFPDLSANAVLTSERLTIWDVSAWRSDSCRRSRLSSPGRPNRCRWGSGRGDSSGSRPLYSWQRDAVVEFIDVYEDYRA